MWFPVLVTMFRRMKDTVQSPTKLKQTIPAHSCYHGILFSPKSEFACNRQKWPSTERINLNQLCLVFFSSSFELPDEELEGLRVGGGDENDVADDGNNASRDRVYQMELNDEVTKVEFVMSAGELPYIVHVILYVILSAFVAKALSMGATWIFEMMKARDDKRRKKDREELAFIDEYIVRIQEDPNGNQDLLRGLKNQRIYLIEKLAGLKKGSIFDTP